MILKFKAKVTNICHDMNKRKSKIYFNHGKNEVILERPMTKKYEWETEKGVELKTGDIVELTLSTGNVKEERK